MSAVTPSAAVAATLEVWRRHNRALASGVVGSLAVALALAVLAAGPDGRDPFYVAVAIEFAAWAIINALFVTSGVAEVRRLGRQAEPARREAVLLKQRKIERLLRINQWFNAGWLTLGAGLVLWGYGTWSAALVGHGVGVFVQATILTVLDVNFARALAATHGSAEGRSDAGAHPND